MFAGGLKVSAKLPITVCMPHCLLGCFYPVVRPRIPFLAFNLLVLFGVFAGCLSYGGGVAVAASSGSQGASTAAG